MVGVIRKRDILAHPIVTVRSFGWPVLFRALLARRNQTFLSLLVQAHALRPPTIQVPELLDRCIDLELSARRIYEKLAGVFSDREAVRRFFETLAEQELGHAELLGLCREAAGRQGWLEEQFAPWRNAVPRLTQQMASEEACLRDLDSLTDALRLVIRVEGSEINQVFDSVVAATDSDFVRTLRAFHTAETEHLAYIADQIPELEPRLASECRELRR
jgi:rubrerythrin